MSAKPAPKVAGSTRKPGRPSVYSPAISDAIKKLAEEGKTDDEIAAAVGVSRTTLTNWKKKHPEFLAVIREAKEVSDAKVEMALFERATGYSHADVDIRVIDGRIVKTELTKHYPPDFSSISFWLRNRKPEVWRDKTEVGVTDKAGNDVPIDAMELARSAYFLLAKASAQQIESRDK